MRTQPMNDSASERLAKLSKREDRLTAAERAEYRALLAWYEMAMDEMVPQYAMMFEE